MVGNIRNAFVGLINQTTWMDTYSKGKAVEKVRDRIMR